MGKRTKYQEKETAQLVVAVEATNIEVEGGKEATAKPAEFELNDDLLLESIQFTDVKETRSLTPLDQATLLAFW